METTIISFNWTGSIGLYRFYPALFHSIFSSSLSSLPPNFYVSHFCKPSHPPPPFSPSFFFYPPFTPAIENLSSLVSTLPLSQVPAAAFSISTIEPQGFYSIQTVILYQVTPFFFCRKKSLNGVALSAYLTYVTLPWNKIMKGQFSCMPTVKSF